MTLMDFQTGQMHRLPAASDSGPLPRKAKALPLPPGNTFTRTLTANIVGHVLHETPSHVVGRMWPSDRVTAEMVERAASAPATTGTAGWAAELAQKKIVDTLAALYPYSAAAALFTMGTTLTFDGAGAISVPGFVAAAGNKGFIAEGLPIPVQQFALSVPSLLKPTKLAGIVVLTREMIESSNAEQLISDTVLRMIGSNLDQVLVDTNAATADRPAGLRSGISNLTASTITGDTWGAALADFKALVNSVGVVAANAPIGLLGSPGRALAARVLLTRDFPEAPVVPVYGTAALTTDFICIASAALVSAVGDPSVESGNAATLHMDTVPTADIGSASRHASMFQTDSIAIKLRWPVSWILRDPRGLAWMTPLNW